MLFKICVLTNSHFLFVMKMIGEYLIDPVIGGTHGNSSSQSSSPNKNVSHSPTKHTAHEQRQSAALSLRNTLDALTNFIDARCVLITIHAQLCCQSTTSCGYGRIKWNSLTEQCRLARVPITLWAKEACISKSTIVNIERELKSLELVLTSIESLLECNLFNCIVNIRRLQVLLGKSSYQGCLPLMYIQSSIPGLLAMMHIYFANERTDGLDRSVPSKQNTTPSSNNRKSFDKIESISGGKSDFNSLVSEFIGRNVSGLPLTVVLARKVDESLEKQNVDEEVEHIHWESIYMKSTRGNAASNKKDWTDLEKILTKHCSSVVVEEINNPVKYESVVGREFASGNIQQRAANPLNRSQMLSYHATSITDSICLVAIQGPSGHKRQHRVSDDDIQNFLQTIRSKICPENLFDINVVVRLRSKLFATKNDDKQMDRRVPVSQSLWSESAWSSDKQKKILQNVLRRKNSPVMAPLKSPYLKRQIRHRRKSTKTSINHGHLDLFLGPELSRLLSL